MKTKGFMMKSASPDKLSKADRTRLDKAFKGSKNIDQSYLKKKHG
jgi:hypothetical protein